MLGTVHEAVGSIVVQVREAAAAFIAMPVGFVPAPVAAGALRGGERPDTSPPHALRVPLGDSALWAEVQVAGEPNRRAGLTVRVAGEPHGRLSLRLREDGPDGATLARYTVQGGEAVVLKGLRPGSYVLEIVEAARQLQFRVPVDVQSET